MASVTSREFNQDSGRAKRAALAGPVFITDRGRPSHVLLTYEDYERLAGQGPSIADLLAEPDGLEDFDLELPRSIEYSIPASLD